MLLELLGSSVLYDQTGGARWTGVLKPAKTVDGQKFKTKPNPQRTRERSEFVVLSPEPCIQNRNRGLSGPVSLRRARMESARHLLETSFLSVKQIMVCVGINDISHFARCFKDTYGLTPTGYRNRTTFPLLPEMHAKSLLAAWQAINPAAMGHTCPENAGLVRRKPPSVLLHSVRRCWICPNFFISSAAHSSQSILRIRGQELGCFFTLGNSL